MHRSVIVCSLAALSIFVAAVPSVSAQADPTSVLQQLLAAFNRNDQAAILNLFTDDAVIIGGPCGGGAGGECVGKAMLQDAIRTGGPVQVQLTADAPLVSGAGGNVATFRVQERFELPPQAVSAGVTRQVEVGTIVVSGGKVSRLALVADVTDPQTVTLQHVFATLGPPPNAQGPSGTVASDGQSLGTQPPSVAQSFASIWGAQAPARWVQEHEAAIHSGAR